MKEASTLLPSREYGIGERKETHKQGSLRAHMVINHDSPLRKNLDSEEGNLPSRNENRFAGEKVLPYLDAYRRSRPSS